LVDPDNRRPVDFDHRRQMLNELRQQLCTAKGNLVSLARELLNSREDGRIKLFVIHCTLNYRREHADIFRAGAYVPLEGIGRGTKHTCTFARQHDEQVLIIAVPRLLAQLIPDPHVLPIGPQIWADSWLPVPPTSIHHRYHNLFTGEAVETVNLEGKPVLALGDVFANFPVALLVGSSG